MSMFMSTERDNVKCYPLCKMFQQHGDTVDSRYLEVEGTL